jgi:hypothetical protein
MASWSVFSTLKNMPDKLECYITLGRKGLPVTNNLAFWTHLKVMKKMKYCEYGSWLPIHNT